MDRRSSFKVGDFDRRQSSELENALALGGGARGGGSFVCSGDDAIIFDNPLSCKSSSSSSLALGTISERNSISSEERAREFRETKLDDLLRENRLRNRETADGACSISACGGNGGAGCGGGGRVETKAGSEDAVTLDEDGLTGEDVGGNDGKSSTLARGELVLATPGGGVLTG